MSESLRLVKRETVYRGRVLQVVRETIACGDQRMVRETILHPGSVVIVPMAGPSSLVFVRQYRRALDRTILELPAGTLAPGEPPLQCAKRELEEETGWRAARWRGLGRFYPAPGFLAEHMTIFLAQELRPGPARPEPDEILTPVRLSLSEALRKIRSGAICDAKSIIGVLFAQRWLAKRRREA